MKKTILFALLCVLSVSSYAIEASKCALQHNGSLKMYDASAIATAIKDAVDGDILYLGSGSFSGFTINKAITVRGAGTSTQVIGDIYVSIPDNPVLTEPTLEGVYCSGEIRLTSAMDGVIISQCECDDFGQTGSNKNVKLVRCMIRDEFRMTDYIKGLIAENCKIQYIYTSYNSPYPISSNVCKFVNCDIYSLNNCYNNTNYIKGTFINCRIIYYSNYKTYTNCIFVNTLHAYPWTIAASSSEQNCYYDSEVSSSTTVEELTSKGYLGQDGTVVGAYGGTTPYTLDLAIPKVTSSTISVDNENKKLNVSLKVTSK